MLDFFFLSHILHPPIHKSQQFCPPSPAVLQAPFSTSANTWMRASIISPWTRWSSHDILCFCSSLTTISFFYWRQWQFYGLSHVMPFWYLSVFLFRKGLQFSAWSSMLSLGFLALSHLFWFLSHISTSSSLSTVFWARMIFSYEGSWLSPSVIQVYAQVWPQEYGLPCHPY